VRVTTAPRHYLQVRAPRLALAVVAIEDIARSTLPRRGPDPECRQRGVLLNQQHADVGTNDTVAAHEPAASERHREQGQGVMWPSRRPPATTLHRRRAASCESSPNEVGEEARSTT
jgi:hypothetical protein